MSGKTEHVVSTGNIFSDMALPDADELLARARMGFFVRKLIRDRSRFVLGIAIEEIEAWWLADRTNTLAWSGFSAGLPPGCRYGSRKYKAEKDKAPKKTLNELTRLSNRIDRYYGDGNLDLATDFAEEYWQGNARLDEISVQCPRGFVPFQNVVTSEFRQAKSRSGRLW